MSLKQLSKIADTITNPINVSDLSDLVTGDADSIREILDWLTALDRERLDTITMVKGGLHASQLRPKARVVTLARLRDEIRYFADLLRDKRYKRVVSDPVIEWTAPMCEEAADACEELARDAERGELSEAGLDRWIGAVKVAWLELNKLMQLLVAQHEKMRRDEAKLKTVPSVPVETTGKRTGDDGLGKNRGGRRGRPRRTPMTQERQKKIAENWYRFYDDGSHKEHKADGTAKQQYCEQFNVELDELEAALRQNRRKKTDSNKRRNERREDMRK